LVYQPINSLNTRAAVSFEALVRWEHPTDGVISPFKFIPIAEFSGLIHPLGRFILREACHQFQRWREARLVNPEATINVNISTVQLMHSDFLYLIHKVLEESKLSPDRLCLEVTESALITNPEEAKKKLQDVREWGVKVHLDDFGTGFSSLSFLTMFPIDAIKINRQFISAISDNKNFALVRSMQLITQALGINLIAEGIETNEQCDMLIELSCEFGQGYYFSKPFGGEDQLLFAKVHDIK
jgi:EAL domain-containing protein (putative c-di-GMP-specific phosphodiesterase class I)